MSRSKLLSALKEANRQLQILKEMQFNAELDRIETLAEVRLSYERRGYAVAKKVA